MSAAEQLLRELSRQGIEIWADGDRLNYRAAAGRMSPEIKERLRAHRHDVLAALRRQSSKEILPQPELLDQPFPLTDVQQAYWIGRDASYELGGVAAHSYVETEAEGLDRERLEHALNRLIERHDMLRMVVLPTGEQRILTDAPRYRVASNDLSALSESERQERLLAIRDRMSHQVLQTERWPLFEVVVSDLGHNRSRVHVSLDLLIADAASVLMLVRECLALYNHPEQDLPPIGLSFRDYVLAEKAQRNGHAETWQQSLAWWRKRIETLPSYPQLPLSRDPASLTPPRFVRRSARLNPDEWSELKNRARSAGLTPSMVLCAAYAEVLAAWSKERRFTLNLTLFNRLPKHADVSKLVGDFTSGLLLEADFTQPASFEDRARGLQNEFWTALEHSRVSSVQVIRELARAGGAGRAAMPVVFTSLLQQDEETAAQDWSRSILYGVSQTPQVWLDHQVFELGGALVFNWDAVEDLFPRGLLDDVFAAYVGLLHKLASGDGWTAPGSHLPAAQREIRSQVNATSAPVSADRLEDLFLRSAARTPDAIAVLSDSRTLTYGELDRVSAHLANQLAEHRIARGEPVAIVMRKGWEQVAAALGILRAGGAYLPIEASLPPERIRYLLEESGVRAAIVQPGGPDRGGWPALDAILTVDPNIPDASAEVRPAGGDARDLAYIIYTSGSTGQPKGVMIDHRGAVNTILDINQRFGIGPEDRVLALSALNFDLSVYDLFGMFAAGGAIVLPGPDAARSPEDWAELAARHNVTVWNSVPALMEMLAEHLGQAHRAMPAGLRLIMMSGDWIPLSLPERIRALGYSARIISLGGATEASIWSILYPIEGVDPGWKSIPYGRPMVNQRFYVLDSCLQDRPDWVPGELYIGGIGVALGYWRDEEKTRARFIPHPATGERLYRTGDWGRFLPDGNIEFLGRDDNQVKVLGHRIELGEIEAALRAHPSVREAVVTAPGPRERRRLVAHVVPANDARAQHADDVSWDAVREAALSRTNKLTVAGAAEIQEFVSLLDRVCTYAICATLRGLGAFGAAGERVALHDLVQAHGIPSHQAVVLSQWIGELVHDGTLSAESGGVFVSPQPLPDAIPPEHWAALEQHPLSDPKLIEYFRNCFAAHAGLLTGRAAPLELLFPGGSWHMAERLYQSNPAARYANGIAAAVMEAWARQRGGVIRVLEAGAGTGATTASLLEALPPDRTRYTYTDVTPFFRAGAREKFRRHPFLEYRLFDINRRAAEQGFEPGSFDAIVASNTMHIAADVTGALRELAALLAPGGLLLLVEGTRYPRYLMTSATGFLEGLGIAPSADHRPPLLPVAVWRDALASAGYTDIAAFPENGAPQSVVGLNVIACRSNPSSAAAAFNTAELRSFLRERLPDYMVPAAFVTLPELPLTANGKVDRNVLSAPAETAAAAPSQAPETDDERELAAIWAELLERESVGATDNFFELGGDSLLAVQLSARVRERMRREVPLRAILENPTVRSMAAAIAARSRTAEAAEFPPLVPDPAARHEPFPLTGVQEAYWIGRTGSFELGNTPCQVYLEFEGTNWDPERLSDAWNRVIERHEMLRATFLPDGRQRILEAVDRYDIPLLDLSGETPENIAQRLAAIQDEMAYANREVGSWPLFEIRVTRLDARRMRLHVCIEALIADGWSLLCLFRDWNRFYLHPDEALPPPELSFRDYVLARDRVEQTATYHRAREYWQARISNLPPAPQLPLARDPESLKTPRFRRRTSYLSRAEWERFRASARRLGLTASNALVSAFSEALATWSRSAHFTLNLTQFNRIAMHPQVNDVVGDFTSLTLLEVNHALPGSFADRARRVQGQLADDLEHRYYGGIEVIRALAHRMGGPRALMPVVFTSMLNFAEKELNSGAEPHIFGSVVSSVSQTPQVWLDHQAWEENGQLVLSWDAIDELFPDGLLDQMFAAYSGLVRQLAAGEQAWLEPPPLLVPEETIRMQNAANDTAAPVSDECLHTLVEAQVRRRPQQIAVRSAERELTYAELWDLAQRLGRTLAAAGARPNTHVAVLMDKGWEQIPAVLGVLLSGAAYLPVDAGLPPERIAYLVAHSEAVAIVTQPWHRNRTDLPSNIPVFCLEDGQAGSLPPAADPERIAYTIYTSGSTGMPKGVVIDHRGAVNTILDVNRRFSVGPEDRVLALSALSFDLSVWDIFGTLAAGGTVVVPPAESRRDPDVWLRLLERERITIWNSVPALMRMLVEHARGRDVPPSLRLVMMSGDWIPVSLPAQIRELFPAAATVSLGGATEASIWSILYPIGDVDPAWPSIPYGKAMVNQRFYVLDDHMQPRPVWAPGELYIGGIGLAREYWREPEKTSASFLHHPATGERLYRTGDIGRYLPDGNIEFLGREDFQVKIQGFRVELGEIESALESHPMVKAAVAAAAGERQDRRLVAYVVPAVQVDATRRLEMKAGHARPQLEGLETLRLPDCGGDAAAFLARRTHRRFDPAPLPLERLARWLGCLRRIQPPGSMFYKYRYPSAGDLYAVQVYVSVKPGRVEGLEAGNYYYDPEAHRLALLNPEPEPFNGLHIGQNESIFEDAAVSLHLVADLAAVEPLYGPVARDFCLLEAGYMGQLLMTAAQDSEIGVCPVGNLNFDTLRPRLRLSAQQVHAHTLLAGCAEPAAPDAVYVPSLPRESAALDLRESLTGDLREYLRQRLPEYMVPSAFVLLDEIPLSSNGKVDRKALAAAEPGSVTRSAPFQAPETPLERKLADAIREVLNLERIGIHENFFELGATSMQLVQVGNLLRARLDCELPIVELFTHPNIQQLADYLKQQENAAEAAPRADDAARERGRKQRQAILRMTARGNA